MPVLVVRDWIDDNDDLVVDNDEIEDEEDVVVGETDDERDNDEEGSLAVEAVRAN